MVVGLWLTPFLLRHLGQREYGLWLTALQILTYVALLDLGVIALVPRTVAYATGRTGSSKNTAGLSGILGQTTLIVLAQTPVVALVAAIAWAFLPPEWIAMRGPIESILATYAFLFPFRIFAAVLEGLQEQAFVGGINLVSWIAGTVANVALLVAGFGLYALTIGWIFSQVLNAAGCALRVWTAHREVIPRRLPKLSKKEVWPQITSSFWVSFNQIGLALMSGADLLLVSKILGPGMVVPYALTGKLASVLGNQPQLLMNMAAPGLSEMRISSSKESIYQASSALSQGMLLLTGLISMIILVVNEEFVHLWVGSNQYGGFALTCMILGAMLLRHWNVCMTYTVFCFGYERRLAISGLLNGCVTAGASFLLIPRFHYLGAVAGSVAGLLLIALPVNLTTTACELEMSVARLVRPFWPWCRRLALLACVLGVITTNWPPRSLLQMCSTAAVVAVVYCAVMFRPILASPLGPYVKRTVERAKEGARVLVARSR